MDEYKTMIDEMKRGKDKVKTPFGNASRNTNGRYRITSRKEGNKGKLLHRLIWEDFYGKPIPKGYEIHHKDGNPINNDIRNLQCCESFKHNRFHGKQKDNSGYSNARAKYTLWDIKNVKYNKREMFRNGRTPNPVRCFTVKYNGKPLNIGWFYDFVTPEIIVELINDVDGDD